MSAPTLLLPHGLPTASHLPYPRARPARSWIVGATAPHGFEQMAKIIDRCTEVVGLDRYAVYAFDPGAPTGFRIAVKHSE